MGKESWCLNCAAVLHIGHQASIQHQGYMCVCMCGRVVDPWYCRQMNEYPTRLPAESSWVLPERKFVRWTWWKFWLRWAEWSGDRWQTSLTSFAYLGFCVFFLVHVRVWVCACVCGGVWRDEEWVSAADTPTHMSPGSDRQGKKPRDGVLYETRENGEG